MPSLIQGKTERVHLVAGNVLTVTVTSGSVGVYNTRTGLSRTTTATESFGRFDNDMVFTINPFSGSVASYDTSLNQYESPVPVAKTLITESRNTSRGDDQNIAANNTSNNYTITVDANTIPNGMILQQLSTGTVTVAAGAGVTFIGSTLATSAQGQRIVIEPTPIANTFNIKVA